MYGTWKWNNGQPFEMYLKNDATSYEPFWLCRIILQDLEVFKNPPTWDFCSYLND